MSRLLSLGPNNCDLWPVLACILMSTVPLNVAQSVCSMHELFNSQIAEGGEVETSHYFKTSGIICLSPYLLS